MATAEKITALTALTAPVGADLLCIVDDVAGTPTTKKMTIANLFLNIPAQIVGIGDTANAKMTVGLTINQGASDDEILALKSSDITHGITDQTETDTFFLIKKLSGAEGGAKVAAYSEGASCYQFWGISTTGDTTKSTAAIAPNQFISAKKSGTGLAAMGADENIVCFQDYSLVRALIDKEGELHTDAIIGVGDDWDEWDDLALASDLSRLPKAKFNEMMKYKAEDFERAGLLTLSTDEHGNRHAFIRHKAMLQFAMCCFAEIAKKLRVYENALLSLGVSPKLLQEVT